MDVHLLKQIVLVERLPSRHAAKEQTLIELKRSLAGAAGEQRTVDLLERELDLGGRAAIYRDVSLPYLGSFVQIDILLVHRHLLCVLEVKNMVGEFHFDSANFQFHRVVDGRMEGMRNPESQLHRAVKAAEKFFGCKVHGTIVLSSRSGKVAVAPKIYPVIALDYLPFHLENLADPKHSLDFGDLEGFLRRSCGQYNGPDLFAKHKLERNSLVFGVRCLSCRRISCEWKDRKWRCGTCGFASSDAHEYALQEYAVLFGSELSSKEAYRWLGVDDKYVLFRLLEKTTLKSRLRGRRTIIENKELLVEYFKKIYT